MNKRLKIVSDRGHCFKKKTTKPLETAICGNGVVEPGEECDCGPDIYHCNDPCCYPANIMQDEKLYYNKSAIPCSTNNSRICNNDSPLVYGVYVPLTVIIFITLAMTYALKKDWSKDKILFRHVTEGNIRIVTIHK